MKGTGRTPPGSGFCGEQLRCTLGALRGPAESSSNFASDLGRLLKAGLGCDVPALVSSLVEVMRVLQSATNNPIQCLQMHAKTAPYDNEHTCLVVLLAIRVWKLLKGQQER